MSAACPLSGKTVLLVEDEGIVAMLAEDIFEQAGCNVDLAMRLTQAMELAQTGHYDFAVLDVNLGDGQTSYPVAQVLRQRAIPFLFVTGYDPAGIDRDFQNLVAVRKPYVADELVGAACALVG